LSAYADFSLPETCFDRYDLVLDHVEIKRRDGTAGKYTMNQLAVIKKRLEDGLVFFCDIAW
jgi:hypothetical protein